MQDFDEKIKKYLYYFGFGGKMLLFAQLCDRNFGGMRSRRSPKVQHIKKEPRRAHFIDSEEFLTYEYLLRMPGAIVESLNEIDSYGQTHGAELCLERSDIALVDSDQFAAHVDEVMGSIAVRDRRIGGYLLRAERVRKELRIYHLTIKRLCRVTINQSTITNRHRGELDDGTYHHVVEVLDLEGVGGGLEMGVTDTRVVGEEERGAVRR